MDNIQDTALTPTKKVKLLPLRIIGIILYILITAFFAYMLIDMLIDKPQNLGLSLAVYLVLLLTYGSIAYGVDLILCLVGFIISLAKRKKENAKGSIIFFAILVGLILVTYLTLFLTAYLTANSL